jgi:hypothetical protein
MTRVTKKAPPDQFEDDADFEYFCLHQIELARKKVNSDKASRETLADVAAAAAAEVGKLQAHLAGAVTFEASVWKSLEEDEIWPSFSRARPATRRRLIAHFLQVCSDLGDPLPKVLADLAASELKSGKAPRNRIADLPRAMKAARFWARNPNASLSEIAVAVGLKSSNKTTVREWKRRPLFRRAYRDEAWLIEIEKWRAAGNKDAPFPRQLTEEQLSKRIVQQKVD